MLRSCVERAHTAKSGAGTERSALRGAAARASVALSKAQAELAMARAAGNRARGQNQCRPECRTKLAAEASAQADVDAARLVLLQAERKATTESPLKAPAWLLSRRLSTGLPSWRSGRDFQVGPGFLVGKLPKGGGVPWSAGCEFHRRRRRPRARADPDAARQGD